jgi:hypothetical protein
VAQVSDSHNMLGRNMTVEVDLTDASNNTVSARSDWAGRTIPPWYPRPPWSDPGSNCKATPVEKSVLGTVRIPAACFTGSPAFSFGSARALRVKMREKPGRPRVRRLSDCWALMTGPRLRA